MFSKMVYLYCDGRTENCECDNFEASWGDGMFETINKYKLAMKIRGWHFRGREAYCPSCWHILKGKPNDQS